MHDNRTHPLLEQVPLTVSPFVKLPTATTLPYTYKPMPNSLPPSQVGLTTTASPMDPNSSSPGGDQPKPQYVVSSTGHAAHPNEIIASCRALLAHIAKMQADAEESMRKVDERIQARELAEKRRLAPGWLDSDARLLEPERKSVVPVSEAPSDPVGPGYGGSGQSHQGQQQQGAGYGHHYHDGPGSGMVSEMAVPDEGEQLDRAFGPLALRPAKPQGHGQGQQESSELGKW